MSGDDRSVVGRRTAAGLVLTVLVAMGLAACGGGESADVSVRCTVYDNDASVAFTFAGKVTEKESTEGCGSLAQHFSSSSSYWRSGTPPLPKAEPELVCALEMPAKEKQSGVVYVESNPESVSGLGTELCGSLAHAGWTESSAPTGSTWVHAWRAEQGRIQAAEKAERVAREEVEAEREAESEAWHACETDAQEKLDAEREAIQAEYEPLETGSTEHIYEVQEEAEELELQAEGRELHSIGRCQRQIERKDRAEPGAESGPGSGVVEPEAGTEYR
jgi:hypothetical protein